MSVTEIKRYAIGIDIGGTFTDAVVADERGHVFRSKAFTTHSDFPEGILNALKKVCEKEIGIKVEELLSNTRAFVNGTTIVTNSLAEMRGLRVGLLTTAGFGDSLRIARSARTNEWNLQTQVAPPEIVGRDCIAEIWERVDYSGKVLVPLQEEQVRESVRKLVEEAKVEAISVCLLWSFQNPSHERRIKEIIQEMYPNLFISISSEIYPVSREYERTVTTVLNAFTARGTEEYLSSLEKRLSQIGLRVPVGMIQSTGGIVSTAEAKQKPISLLNSGPVGGVIASNSLGKALGLKNIITADMGGTSFDTSVIVDNEITHIHRARINRLDTGLSLVDITAIGAGGGSVGWINEQGLPQVGPKSAGSSPGPACYGNGGEDPTITDVAVTLNFIDPEYFLGGDVKLDKEAAIRATRNKISNPLGISENEAAAGLYDLVINNMSNAARAVSIEKGYDPREFTMVSYGGASALYICEIASELGVSKVVIPSNASVFSAYGLLWSDYSRNYVQTTNWNLASGDPEQLNIIFNKLTEQAKQDLMANGFAEEEIQIIWEGDFKFNTQAFELTIPLEKKSLDNSDKKVFAEAFKETYERLYGEGTAWEGAEKLTLLLNCRVTGIGATAKPVLQEYPLGDKDPSSARTSVREVFLPKKRDVQSVAVYKDSLVHPGMKIAGPAIVESVDTTIFIPKDWAAKVDQYRNYVVESQNQRQ